MIYNKYYSKFPDQYNKIIVESIGGQGNNDYEKEEKIIKNISKQVFIEKQYLFNPLKIYTFRHLHLWTFKTPILKSLEIVTHLLTLFRKS